MPPRPSRSLTSAATTAPSIYTHCSSCLRRQFSSAPKPQTRLRRTMFAWLQGPGENFRTPLPGSTNYLTAYDQGGRLMRSARDMRPTASEQDPDELDLAAEENKLEPESRDDLRPFPLNNAFISEPILSEDLRKEVWKRVMQDGKSVRTVSVELGVDMRRVGAVVRLVELERQMRKEGKPLALPYARAVHAMVPTTPFTPGNATPHESINDLPVHVLTDPQVFYPTSESRAFNRTDAGRIFSGAPRLPDSEDVGQGGKPAREPWQDYKSERVGKGETEHDVLKPADARIPHPHLIAYAKDQYKLRGNDDEIRGRYNQRLKDDAEARARSRQHRLDVEEARKTRVDTNRWQFVVTNVQTSRQGTGLDGRGKGSPGIRYGVPHEDRKKGQVKIPTKVKV